MQPVEDQGVGPLVPGVAEFVGVVEADLLAHRQQQLTGVSGHLGGQRRIGQAHRFSIGFPSFTGIPGTVSTVFAFACPRPTRAVGVLALILVGCSTAGASPTLAGTSWRLVAIQSMDDEQGTTTVPDPSKFTVSFGADGRAAFQIDCNRGNGSWEAVPSGEDSGR